MSHKQSIELQGCCLKVSQPFYYYEAKLIQIGSAKLNIGSLYRLSNDSYKM